MNLTTAQARCAKFVAEFTRDMGYPPTTREIAEGLEVRSTNGVRKHIDALIDKGYMTRRPGVARGLRVTREV